MILRRYSRRRGRPRSLPRLRRKWGVLAALGVLFLPAGCVEPPAPAPVDRAPSHALADPETTRLGRMLLRHDQARDRQSGFSLIVPGPDALRSLRSFIALAEKTLDLQYYIWRGDESGRLVLSDLVDAASGGVRVRLLLDDMDTKWEDGELARLNALPNFEIRIFNPFASRTSRLVDALVDFRRVTHRMHNKLFIADNTVAVIGGRNIGDRYFSKDEEASYRDLDIHAAGHAARALSRHFDAFWNSPWSVSIDALDDGHETAAGVREMVERLKRTAARYARTIEANEIAPAEYAARVFSGLIWSRRTAIVADSHDKPQTKNPKLLEELFARLSGRLEKGLLIEAAYFIPAENGVRILCGFVKAGMDVRVLTNSLSSSDVITAYAGYRIYRRPLLECGVQLYEMRRGAKILLEARRAGDSSIANLHTKAAVFDRRYTFVGSFNLDPRSVYLNTEIALLVDSRPLAEAAARFIEDGMSPENAYRLTLEDGEIVWNTTRDGAPLRLTEEPGATLWKDFASWMIGLLPIERQL
ncbi:MAG: phospholipase D family protein [Alphaproteobacteria bacterium]|nr:phospholipase D family protein [Alphaproteobacteria bacterium]